MRMEIPVEWLRVSIQFIDIYDSSYGFHGFLGFIYS
jgi:hypothetical protein